MTTREAFREARDLQLSAAMARHARKADHSESAHLAKTITLADRCRRKFLHYFHDGFKDETYLAWERGYKWDAHRRWDEHLNAAAFDELLRSRSYEEIAARAIAIESRTNLLFSFEKMALRDAVRSRDGARLFAEGLRDFLYEPNPDPKVAFEGWCDVVARLPRKQTRVLTWPIVTVFGFIALPRTHIFLKPNVTRRAADAYGFNFEYASRPSWNTYASLLTFARDVKRDLGAIRPRDMIDVQSFLWVQGSDEYPHVVRRGRI
jgi:hypothetical protein